MPEEVRAQKGQAAATSDQRHLQRAGVRDRRSNFYWKGTMNFPFSLRKTSLAVKKQAMHFKIGSYSSNKSLNYGNCKHWAASPSLSFSFVLASPTQRKKKKKICSQLPIHVSLTVQWELPIEIFIWSEQANWQIPMHPCRARAEPSRRTAGGWWLQLSLQPQDPVMPECMKKEAVVQQRGQGKQSTWTDFMLCSRKLAKILICFWEKKLKILPW